MPFVVLLAALLAVHQTSAQNNAFLKSPVELWKVTVPPVNLGNECVLSPELDPVLICTSMSGTIFGLDPNTGKEVWIYIRPSSLITSTSGVTFSENGTTFVSASSELNVTNYRREFCKVHLFSSHTGKIIAESKNLLGRCSGTPLLSSDDAYIFVTSNGLSGTFTILKTDDMSILYTFTDKSQWLSPPGIFFTPTQGNYQNGVANSNDLVIFGNRPLPFSDQVTASSALFAFQFPINYPIDNQTLVVTELLNNTDFQGTTAPLITNDGNSMFWGVSRSKVVGWENTPFDRSPGGKSIGFNRGDPRSTPILADLAMGSNVVTPTLYTGNAGPGFAAIATTGEELTALWRVNTTLPVYTQAKVGQKNSNEVVFFIEEIGLVYAVNTTTGKIIWQNSTEGMAVRGNFALNAANDTIYFGDLEGNVRAWQVADFPPSTPPPTAAPVSPTTAPVPPITAPVTSTVAPTMGEASSSVPTSGTAPNTAPMSSTTTAPTVIVSEAPTSAPQTILAPTSGISVTMKIGIFLATSLALSFLV